MYVALPPAKYWPLQHMRLQKLAFWPQLAPASRHAFVLGSASVLFAILSEASAIPAKPRPNFFSAPRRVTDWARPLVISSNLLFITFLSFCFLFSVLRGRSCCFRFVAHGPTRRKKMLSWSVSCGWVQAATKSFPTAASPW